MNTNSNINGKYAIICNKLTKSYGTQVAVDQIDLKIRYGSIFGLLGPNGAGKTTIIKMLTGLVKPSNGDAHVVGYSVAKEEIKVKENIGWISSEVILDESLNTMENLWIQSNLHNIGNKWKKKAVSIMKYFELDENRGKKVSQLSTGTRKKLEITMALLHEPKVLFMDEPTIGLDANTRRLLWNLVKKINKIYGVTILLTTHYIEEADILCDEIAIINQGKIIAIGSPQKLKSIVGGDLIEIEFFSNFDVELIKTIEGVKTMRYNESMKVEDPQSEKQLKAFIKVNDAETVLPTLISTINKSKPNNIKSIKIEKPNLESIFLELTGMRINEIEEKEDKEIYSKRSR
ncbi:MAG: ATP-binding cassette domain-containing protein [Thermoproteota archaeon]|nr:ATP-binding cassette domain-containing protein [Thermoproteota archaeon]